MVNNPNILIPILAHHYDSLGRAINRYYKLSKGELVITVEVTDTSVYYSTSTRVNVCKAIRLESERVLG